MTALLDPTPILSELALLFGLSVVVALLVHRIKMPPIAGFLVAGIIAGPHGIGLIQHRELVEQLAEIGVVVLLFTVGMELAVGHIGRMKRAILVGGGLQVTVTICVAMVVAKIGGVAWGSAIFVGFLIALSSTAAISKLLTDRGELNSPAGRHAIGVCIAQDLAVVPMILVLPILAGGDGADGGISGALLGIAKASGWLVLAVVIAWFAVPRMLWIVSRTRSRELFVLTVISICLALSAVTGMLGLSLALGAFLAGVVLGSSDYHHQAMSEVEPFRDTLASLFFLSIGMLFDGSIVLEEPVLVTTCFVLAIAGKAGIAWIAMRALQLPRIVSWRSALMLAQLGEFGFVLTQLPASRSLISDRLERIFLVVAVLSIALTPLLFAIGAAITRRADRGSSKRQVDSGHELRDHVIIVGFGPVGRMLAGALDDAGVPCRIAEMNAETVRTERAAGRDIVLGDASRPGVLHALGVDLARVLVIAINDPGSTPRVVAQVRRLAPHLHVVARANYLSEVAGLRALEVDEVVPQELETSAEISAHVLRHLLTPDADVAQYLEALRTRAAQSM